MKWNLHNEYIESIPKRVLNKKIENDGLTQLIVDTITKNKKNNDSITFLTDNDIFLEKIVKKIVSLCYKRNIRLNTAMDNHKCIYQDVNDDESCDCEWYFTVNKVSFDVHNKNAICYYFNFVNNNRNFHLTLMLDDNLI